MVSVFVNSAHFNEEGEAILSVLTEGIDLCPKKPIEERK